MVSGSKLKNPSKVSGDSPLSLYYSLIYGNCLGNVVIGMEKCGKMCKTKSELVTVMLPKYVSALLAEKIDLHGYFLTVCIYRNFSSFICITPNMLKEFPNGYANSIRIIIEINGERIDEIHDLPFCRGKAIRKRSLTTVI